MPVQINPRLFCSLNMYTGELFICHCFLPMFLFIAASSVYHLWEFIRDLLKDPKFCPKIIKWENKPEGIFRVVQSNEVAKLWGSKKKNRSKMTYEKLSRSLRYLLIFLGLLCTINYATWYYYAILLVHVQGRSIHNEFPNRNTRILCVFTFLLFFFPLKIIVISYFSYDI